MNANERTAISASWMVYSILGCPFAFSFWISRGQFATCMSRAAAFLGLMILVHFVGYTFYENQATIRDRLHVGVSRQFGTAANSALLQNFLVILLSALVLDFGVIARACLIALAAFWIGVGIVVFRRPLAPTATDLAFVRFGYPPMTFVTVVASHVAWRAMGLI